MTTFAGIKNGYVRQLFTPEGAMGTIPPAQLFAPGMADEWVSTDGLDPQPQCHWQYQGGKFSPPTDYAAAIEAETSPSKTPTR